MSTTSSSTCPSRAGTMLPWVICGLAAVFYCYEYLLRVSPSVMIPELMNAFGVSAAALGNLTAFYYYAYTPAQIPVGVMMDRFGPRFILTFAVLCCAMGTVLFGGTQSFWPAAMGRFLVGFGSAFAFVGVLKLAAVWLPPSRFAFMTGMATALGMVGAMTGQMVMTGLVQEMGWQNTVIYSALLGFVLAPIVWLVVRDAPYGLPKTAKSPSGLGFKQLLKEVSVIMTNRQIWLNGLIGGVLFLPTSVFAELWGIPYLCSVHHMSPTLAAAGVSMIFLGWAIGGAIAGIVSDRIQSRKTPLFVGEIVAAVLMIVLLGVNDLAPFFVLALLFVFGLFSGAQVICFAIGRENCAPHLSGTAIAVTNFTIMLGGAFFQPAVGKLLDLSWSGSVVDGVRIYTPESYQIALMVLPLGLLLSIVLTCFLRETHCKPV